MSEELTDGKYLCVNTRYFEVLGLTDDGLRVRRLPVNDWIGGEPTLYDYGRLDAVLSEHSPPTAFFFDSWSAVDVEPELPEKADSPPGSTGE